MRRGYRYLLLFACAVACARELPVPEAEGTRVSFTLGAPEETQTKVSENGMSGTTHLFKWDAGDQLFLFSHNPAADGNTPVYAATPWGVFTTDAGGASATFSGEVPASYSTNELLVLHSRSTSDISLTWNSGQKRYDARFNIPSEQDGTGVRYSLFAGKPVYDPSSQSLTNGTVALKTALTYFTLHAEDNIRRVTISVSAAKGGNSQFLCSLGASKDIVLNCTGLFLSGGGSNVITVYNGGELLSGSIYFASRHTTGNDTNGYAILTFVFENNLGSQVTKRIRLATGINDDGTASEYKNLIAGRVTKLGTVNFADGEFVYDSNFSPLEWTEDMEADTDRIPDFSRVGYKYGDAVIPSPAVQATVDLTALASALSAGTAADTTAFIQQKIDAVAAGGGGAVLIRNGTYNVSRTLFVDEDNVVLRGESQAGTILKNNSKRKMPVIYMGRSIDQGAAEENATLTFMAGRQVRISSMTAAGNGGNETYGTVTLKTYSPRCPSRTDNGSNSRIIEEYVPLGRLYIEVGNPWFFKPGDKVRVYRPATAEWIAHIGMDRIASNGRSQGPTQQWTGNAYAMSWTRVVTAVRGNRVFLDAPVAQSLESRYGGGFLQGYTLDRISGSGVENLTVDCSYDSSVKYEGNYVDEDHAWIAVQVKAAEHCWIRNVVSRHMGYALADLNAFSRCITVENCHSYAPVSSIQGARRYAFCLSAGAELCLVKNCTCEYDRHSFVTNGTALGPNVFTQCTSTNGFSAIGPHYGWATATLYDSINADTNFEAQDGGNQGAGHGWRGMNTVFWNVSTTAALVAQNVWGTCPDGHTYNRTAVCSACGKTVVPSGRNYAVGCSGQKKAHSVYWDKDFYGNPTTDFFVDMYGWGTNEYNRPDGDWYPARAFESSGGEPISLPLKPGVGWWPSLTKDSYVNRTSLYECQLEQRHAAGIYLNTL